MRDGLAEILEGLAAGDRIVVDGTGKLRPGSKVVEAGDGVSGIQMVSRRAPPIDLVLVDLMLPNLDGLEVIEILSRSHPGLPLLCITGFGATATALLESTLTDYHVPVLLKPFDPQQLLQVVARVVQELAAQARVVRPAARSARKY